MEPCEPQENIPQDIAGVPGLKETVTNVPDVVSHVTSPHERQLQITKEECKSPDIVRSSSGSSSDEKMADCLHQTMQHETPCLQGKKLFAHTQQSVSSFSSSSSSNASPGKLNISTVSSFSSSDDDVLNDKDMAQVKPLERNPRKALIAMNTKTFFSQVSEDYNDVFDPGQPLTKPFGENVTNNTDIHYSTQPLTRSSATSASSTQDISEKGQRARQHYSSSGYGTGSGESGQENSTTKTSQLSEDSMDAEAQSDVTVIPSEVNDGSTPTSYAENDFKARPRRVSSGYFRQIPGQLPAVPEHKNDVLTSGDTDLSVGSQDPQQKQTCEILPLGGTIGDLAGAVCSISSKMAAGQNLLLQAGGHDKPISTSKEKHLYAVSKTAVGVNIVSEQTWTAGSVEMRKTPEVKEKHQYSYSHHCDRDGLGKADAEAESLIQNDLLPQDSRTSLPQSLQPYTTNSAGNFPHHSSQLSSSNSYNLPPSAEAILNQYSYLSVLQQSGPGTSDSSHESKYCLDALLPAKNASSLKDRVNTETRNTEIPVTEQSLPNFDAILPSEDFSSKMSSTALHLQSFSDLSSTRDPKMSLLSSLGYSLKQSLLTKIAQTARCREMPCDNTDCMQIKKQLKELQDEKLHVESLRVDQTDLLCHMFDHNENCPLPKCPFPWCRAYLKEEYRDVADIVKLMKQRLENFVDSSPVTGISETEYIKLSPELPFDSVPKEGTDWRKLCMMEFSTSTILARCPQENQYWVIKNIPISDKFQKFQWNLFSRLRQIQHDSVVQFLWAAELKEVDSMIVCTLYEGLSLRVILQEIQPPYHLQLGIILNIMHQLISCTQSLHQLGIVFLNWSSTSILVTQMQDPCYRVKLCNFSCSALADHYDGGHLFLSLPPNLLTPELRGDNIVELASDVWGLGCLLYELVTSRPVWHSLRHMRDEDLKNEMDRRPVPDFPRVYPELHTVFNACWKVNPSERVSLEQLKLLLVDAFRQHLATTSTGS